MAARAAERLAAIRSESRSGLTIQSLGGFRVLRGGEPVPLGEWQSRKARDLLKILVARRGRPITREAMCEALWPDEDPGPLANRLSVALTTVRTVLDPDRALVQDHFVRADKTTIALETERLTVDLEAFHADADEGRRRLRRGDIDGATRLQLRILDLDPYDEPAHLDLVALLARVGRHGDARRRYEAHAERMGEIGIEAAAFPAQDRQPALVA